MSSLKFILEEQERWSAFLTTSSQRASEPSPPKEYQPDQNYAQGRRNMSTLKYMLGEQEIWNAFLPTSSQRASEPSPPTEYQQDKNYAQGNQCGYGGSFQSSNMEYGYGQQYASQISEADNFILQKFLFDFPLMDAANPNLSQWTKDNEAACIPPQETVMEEELPNDTHLPLQNSYVASTEDSDSQKGEGCELHDQAEKQKLEVNLDHSTRPTDRVKPSVLQPPENSNLNLPLSNSPSAPSNVVEKTAQITAETLPESEKVVQEFDSLFECTVDENPVLRYEAKVGTVTILSYITKNNGESVGMVGKGLEHPCEGVIVVVCIFNEHLGITPTNEVSIAEPRKTLFEQIRMNEFRGWFYDEYDPGDTWIHC